MSQKPWQHGYESFGERSDCMNGCGRIEKTSQQRVKWNNPAPGVKSLLLRRTDASADFQAVSRTFSYSSYSQCSGEVFLVNTKAKDEPASMWKTARRKCR